MVVDLQGRRYLYFGAPFEQSCISLTKPFQPAHDYARAMLLPLGFREPAELLLMGLGGGSLVHAAHHVYPQASLRVFEQRPLVVEIARHYFDLPQLEEGAVVIGDARLLIRDEPANHYDIVFADLFSDDKMLPWQQQAKFFAQCRRILNEQGWLIINYDHLLGDDSTVIRQLRSHFSHVLSFVTREDNQVIMATPDSAFVLEGCHPGIIQLQERLETSFEVILDELQDLSFQADI